MTEHSMGNKTACAVLLIWHSSISLCCRFRHLLKCICSSPPAVCPSCWWEEQTALWTEPNKDRLMDQNSITFKEERGMFAGESHHTFQFPLLHVEVSEPTFSDSYWWQVMPLTRHRENGVCQSSHILHMPLLLAAGFITGDSQRKWTPFNKKKNRMRN